MQIASGAVKIDDETQEWLFSEVAAKQKLSRHASCDSLGLSDIGSPTPSTSSFRPAEFPHLTDWGIDIVHELSEVSHPVKEITEAAISRFGLTGAFGVCPIELSSFLEDCDSLYQKNPYHNSVGILC